jgi:hypothetical protein
MNKPIESVFEHRQRETERERERAYIRNTVVLDDLLNFINIPRAFSCCILPLYIEFRLAHHHIVESNFASHATSVAVEIEFRDGCIFRGQSLSNSKNLYKHDNDDDDESSDTRACVCACVRTYSFSVDSTFAQLQRAKRRVVQERFAKSNGTFV